MKEHFGIYLIATDPVAGYEAVARAAVECNLRYLQLRMKNTARETVIKTARAFRAITRGTHTRFIVNDDLSIAMDVDADGIHLGQTDLAIGEARRCWNASGKIFGLSTHSMEQAIRAMEQQPDYIGIGPVYPTQTKADADPVLGVEEVVRISRAVPITSVAIGGITAGKLPGLLGAGVENFCVASAVNACAEPVTAIHTLLKIIKNRRF